LVPGLNEKSRAFLKERAGNESAVPLGGAYHKSEVAYRDKFIDPYMGKRYPDGHTEIISMGFEHFVYDTWNFAAGDPQYFKFIWKIARGNYK
jgi:hypothetical protein